MRIAYNTLGSFIVVFGPYVITSLTVQYKFVEYNNVVEWLCHVAHSLSS